MRVMYSFLLFLLPLTAAFALPPGVERVLTLAPGPGNQRNSEGDFISLKDGRLVFVYTHFDGGAGDNDQSHLASRVSTDHGATWSAEDAVVLPNEGGLNVMSVSLLRLNDDRIALLYLRKDAGDLCTPLIRFSNDETATWTEAISCIPEGLDGYYVVNNDRLLQLGSGRLVVPAARHSMKGDTFKERGRALCALSDDAGATWRLSKDTLDAPEGMHTGLQEPGVIELRDGRLMMFSRTSGGSQYISYSPDGGETWTAAEPSAILSPVSPASIERIPSSGDLLLVWNNHVSISPQLAGKRTPLTVAISRDEGKTWVQHKNLEDNPDGWFCYTAVHFEGENLLLGLCAGDRRENNGLALTEVLRLPVSSLYE